MKIKLLKLIAVMALVSSFLIPLTVELALAPTSTPTVWIKIYRIQAVDPIEGFLQDGADWRYKIYVWNGEDWSSIEYKPDSNNDDIIVNISHKFEDIKTTTTTIFIDLFEDDSFGAYEIADISSREDVSRFQVTYNLKDNTLDGDDVIVEGAYFKTSGDYDDSVDVDENDANLWFYISDNYDPPEADAGLGQTVYTYEKVNFDGSGSTASSGSSLVKYQWDFENDGIFDAEGETTSYTYTQKGTYTVVLKVTDNLGKLDIDTIIITVKNRAPEASFSYSPSEPTIQDTVSFSDTSEDEDGTVDSWSWDFGDGTTSTVRNPTHQYEDKGTFTATLTVTDNDGASDSVTKTVTIYNLEPTADFSYSPTGPAVDEDVQFTDESEDPEGKQLSFSWDFGDGYTSNVRNPAHKYESARTYTVKLTVTDDGGATDNISQSITIKEKPFFEQQAGGIPRWVILAIIIALVSVVAGVVVIKKRKRA